MATVIVPGEPAFLDTSYALALSAPTDRFHAPAVRLADELEAARTRIVTTWGVVLEVGNALAGAYYRPAAVRLLDSLRADPRVEIVPLTDDLLDRAIDLYRSRPDKEWGLVDCASFVTLADRGITQALTADHHFRQAGYRPLLRDATDG